MFRAIRGIFDSRISGENVIVAIQKLYESTSKLNIGDDPHVRLIKTAISRLKTHNLLSRPGYTDEQIVLRAHALSAIPACLPEGHNSRLLALHLLHMERPDVWGKFPEFQAAEASHYRALEREVEAGNTLLDLYKRGNPLLQIADLDDFGYGALCAGLAEVENRWAEQLEIPAAQNAIKDSTAATADRSTDARTPPPLPTGDDNADEGKVTSDQRPDDDTFNVGDFPKALMAIGYRREAEEAWSQAQHLPTAYMRCFLEALDEDPKCNVLEVLSSLEEEFKKEQRPFDDEAANDALEEVRTISPEAALEFKNVYETFGDTIPLSELFQRIEAHYGPTDKTRALEEQKKQQKLNEEKQRKLNEEKQLDLEDEKRWLETESQRLLEKKRKTIRNITVIIGLLILLILWGLATN